MGVKYEYSKVDSLNHSILNSIPFTESMESQGSGEEKAWKLGSGVAVGHRYSTSRFSLHVVTHSRSVAISHYPVVKWFKRLIGKVECEPLLKRNTHHIENIETMAKHNIILYDVNPHCSSRCSTRTWVRNTKGENSQRQDKVAGTM